MLPPQPFFNLENSHFKLQHGLITKLYLKKLGEPPITISWDGISNVNYNKRSLQSQETRDISTLPEFAGRDSAPVAETISAFEDLDSSVEDQNNIAVLQRSRQVQVMPQPRMPDHFGGSGLRNRKKQRPDGLEHLRYAEDAVQAAKSSNLRMIACRLVQLDIWALKTFKQWYDAYPNAGNEEIYRQFKALVSDEVLEAMGHENNYDFQFEQDIGDILDNYPIAESSKLFVIPALLAENQKYALNNTDLILPEQMPWLKTPQQYFTHLGNEVSDNKQRLSLLQWTCMDIRGRMDTDNQRNELSLAVLKSLIRKLKALHVNFEHSYLIINGEPLVLLSNARQAAWDNYIAARIAKPETQPRPINSDSILLFTVPTICAVSCFLAGLAWMHTPPQIGSSSDGNFYQLLSSSLVQLLGTFTLAPTLLSKTLVGLHRILAWVLAVTSILCTVVSMPLYLYATTAWSGLLSFFGSCAQALILLQFIFVLKPASE
ncbi:hypothetical protein EG329_003724 [Mollisiaceae sp. DMI_Dod_QoI]|nr:hypothetical protein EG329_003724 [Helotiales sp. DMI_Dod_QoI]